MMRRALACAVLLLAAGCTKSNTPDSVTIPVPQVSPAAAMAKDAMLAAMVRAQIATSDVDAAVHMNLQVRDGAVRLRGTVRTESDSRRVAAAVRGVAGVKSVVNDLRVDGNVKTFNGGDFALAARADAALATQTGFNAMHVHASAQDGIVTLKGTLSSAALKETAIDAVRKVSGVKRVVDKINVGS